MFDYNRGRAQAVKMVHKYGTQATLINRKLIPDTAQPWKSVETVTQISVECVVFDDDGETFVNHNITGRTRIALISPTSALSQVQIGDRLVVAGEETTIKLIKQLNPDASGAVLWVTLIV